MNARPELGLASASNSAPSDARGAYQPGGFDRTDGIAQPARVDQPGGFDQPDVIDRAGGFKQPGGIDRAGGSDQPGGFNQPGGIDRAGGVNEPGGIDRAGGIGRTGGFDQPGGIDWPARFDQPDVIDRADGFDQAGSFNQPGRLDRAPGGTAATGATPAPSASSGHAIARVPDPAPRGSRRIPLLTILRMLTRPDAVGVAAVALPAVAFAVVTALTLVVVGGTFMLFNPPPGMESHGPFAVFALTLLAVPLLTLGVAAARLSARRRDDRLATLRLLGASTTVVTVLAVAEATLIAVVGILAGTVLYAVLLPAVGLLHFYGGPIGAASVWVGVPVLLATAGGIAVLAAVSSFAGLAAVRVTPLGVRKRGTAPRVKWFALAGGIVVLLIALGFVSMLQGFASAFGMIGLVIAVFLPFAAGMLAINLIGSPLVGLIGRQMAKRAKSPSKLIGGRRLAEAPGVAWRSVSGIAMISFVAVISGSGLALLDMVDTSDLGADQLVLVTDLRTGVFLTLFIAFLMLACTVGVSQAASILDERKLLIALDRAGMPRKVFEQAQRSQVWAPLLLAALGGAGAAIALVLPIVGVSLVVAPLAMLTMALCFALGFGAVWLALLGTRPVVTSVLASPHRS